MIDRKKSREKRRAEVLSNPDDRAHGTKTGYDYGCRCDRCREALHKVRAAQYQSMKAARERRLQEVIAARESRERAAEEPPAPPKPNPVRVAKHDAAVRARKAKQPKPVYLNELEKALMKGCSVSYDPPRCAVCGRTYPVEKHHVVKRSQGGTDGPTIALCGFGNNLKDANGRFYCHGRAEHRMLHFRWVPSETFGAGHWEYLETLIPMKYDSALKLGGWKRLEGGA